jgi:glycosyltransferase involved in cell wall biosynthesis
MESNTINYSIVIPTFNRLEYLKLLIPKLEALNYFNWEAIIVDDGSTDNTSKFFENFNHDRIHYYKKVNAERGAARNYGVLKSKGAYITFLDSDDFLLPDIFNVASNFLINNPNSKIFHLGFEIRKPNGIVIQKEEKLPAILNEILIQKNVMACCGVFILREVAINFPFNEDRNLSGTEDYELWLRLAAEFQIQHLNGVQAVIVDHQARSMHEDDILKLIKRIEKFIACTMENVKVQQFLGANSKKFLAYRYSYISLHAVISKNKSIALNYLQKALLNDFSLVLSKRFLTIIKKLIIM